MKLEYVGPKPIISHTGIEFDNNKEDKFIYLNIVVQLIKALDHKYFENRTYTYTADTQRLTCDELIRELKHICPDLNSMMEKSNHSIEDEIAHNIKRANESLTLTLEDKEVLTKNINMMHNYLVQRSINKSVYYCAVNALTEMVKKDHIDYIIAPMYQKFAHVFHSVQGVLRKEKFPIDSKIEIYQKDSQLFVKLDVINI
jgi:hypothetical protein